MNPTKSCCFCEESRTARGSEVIRQFGDISRLIAKSDLYYLVPSLGPLTMGHLLLIPLVHVNNFADLPAEAQADALAAIEQIKGWLRPIVGACVVFEHGTSSGAQHGGCGIVHAHIHFVPVGSRRVEVPLGIDWTSTFSTNCFQDVKDVGGNKNGYLLFENPQGDRYFASNVSVPSQYLRQHVARALGINHWDWRAGASDGRVLEPLNWRDGSSILEPRLPVGSEL